MFFADQNSASYSLRNDHLCNLPHNNYGEIPNHDYNRHIRHNKMKVPNNRDRRNIHNIPTRGPNGIDCPTRVVLSNTNKDRTTRYLQHKDYSCEEHLYHDHIGYTLRPHSIPHRRNTLHQYRHHAQHSIRLHHKHGHHLVALLACSIQKVLQLLKRRFPV